MLSNGQVIGDGSWTLRIYVTDLQTERSLRVRGDLHIGGVMLKLVEELEISMDWSDHALWWPQRNIWLTRTKSTLDQCGVHADAFLHFTPMHKCLKVQLPDLRCLDMKVNFSIKTFSAIVAVCKELGIRHPEELSFCKPLTPDQLKHNYKGVMKKKEQNFPPEQDQQHLFVESNSFSGRITPTASSPQIKNGSSNNVSPDVNSSFVNQNERDRSFDSILANTPPKSHDPNSNCLRPKSLLERARMNVAWLDSSLSIMEQDIREFDTLKLRFKFYSFYDLNPKYDAGRINQIYEQSRWQLLNEEIDCTEEEMLMFAALQLQVNLQSMGPQQISENGNFSPPDEDDIDAALSDLQNTLEGVSLSSQNNITQVPELCDELRFFKPKRYTLKAFKRYWFTYKDLHLHLYKSKDEMIHHGMPAHSISLKGCEVSPDVNISQNKFGIKLEVPSSDGMSEIYIRCDDEQQYSKWMAACRLASKGRSLADSSYYSEVKTILEFLQMQKPTYCPEVDPKSYNIQPEDFVAPRHLRKLKGKLVHKILEAHANVKHLSLIEAKLNYIKAWQSLPEYGVSLFVVRFMGCKKDELLGVAHNRLMKLDINTGDHLKTWRFNSMKAWNVNWEVKHMMVQFEDENIVFSCLSADCKVIHEYIGGYIFLSMRSKDANQALNEELFHKLTGGWA